MATAAEQVITHTESLTVCLVDDDPMMRALFSRVIGRTGCNVVVAGDATEAESVLEMNKVDVVLSDLMMPNSSDGEQLLKFVLCHYPSVSVFMMSGNMCPDTQARLMDYGASACIMKPFTAEAFSTLIVNLDRKKIA